MFLGHEVMHGAVLRGRRARLLVGGLCFAPLAVSPHLWLTWHNRLHHAHANRIGVDPDMYPSSSATEDNEPLVGALSVTAPRWVERLTLDFGYHVEHHLFPALSARHARSIRCAIVALWPERYQSMPIGTALRRVFATGRVYRDAVTLVDPRTGGLWPTLAPAEHRRRPAT